MDMLMPILDGESAARMIKSTKNANQQTPIVAVTSYELKDVQLSEEGTMFSAVSNRQWDFNSADHSTDFAKAGDEERCLASPQALGLRNKKSDLAVHQRQYHHL